jgi:ABC-type sugar transport system substrate-binding protein
MINTRKILLCAALTAIIAAPAAMADGLKIGVSMALFDDNFLTSLRNGIEKKSAEEGVGVQIEDAKNEVGTQLNQIQNFIASGVDAIIVNPVDTDATVSMSDDAAAAGIPLIYVNRQPINIDMLPDNQAFVASNEVESGTYQTQEVCRLMNGKGKVLVSRPSPLKSPTQTPNPGAHWASGGSGRPSKRVPRFRNTIDSRVFAVAVRARTLRSPRTASNGASEYCLKLLKCC